MRTSPHRERNAERRAFGSPLAAFWGSMLLLACLVPAIAFAQPPAAPEPARELTPEAQARRDEALSKIVIPTGLPDGVNDLIREQWGVEVVGLRSTGAGHMLDFRYRVIDAEKASKLHGTETKPVLRDLITGKELKVPRPPKLGPLKSTRYAPKKDRTYTIFFANMGGILKRGRKVSIELGDLKIEEIEIQ